MTQPRQTLRPPLRRVREAYVSITGAAYTPKAGDQIIGVNRAGIVTITLPTAQLRSGRVYTIKDESGSASSNNITIATEGAETIDGSATDTISEDYGAKAYYSDGSNWFTIQLLLAATVAHVNTTGRTADDHHDESHSHTGIANIGARAYHSANQSITHNTGTTLAFNSERWDTDTIHDTSSNNSRLTCKTAGKYTIVGQIEWDANSSSERLLKIRLNGSTTIALITSLPMGGALFDTTAQVVTTYDLAVNDYVELFVQQNTGGSLNIKAKANWSPEFSMIKIVG
ncbi:MAG: hypothetical protein IID01_12150 [Chloroflexi bacterium]|nr:hypothetical protein [Chloroflexota bacterium]